LFFVAHVDTCLYENLPAFRIAIPDSLIRLQRREFYRVPTPDAKKWYAASGPSAPA
jgi:flagellar brake protein